MDENRRKFLATTQLIACEDGWEHIAQFVASYIAASEPHDSTSRLFEEFSILSHRVGELLDDEAQIWPELMPGGCLDIPLLPTLEKIALNGIPTGGLLSPSEDKPKSIKIPYPLAIYQTDNTVWGAKMGATFFIDENGEPWVKFIAENGPDRDAEHFLHMNNISHFVRRD